MTRKILLILLAVLLHTSLFAQWQPLTDLPADGRDGAFAFVIGQKAYVGAGILSKDLWELDLVSEQWTAKHTVASGRSRCFATAFTWNGKGYLIGGDSAFGKSMDEVWRYDPALDSWTQLGAFPGGARVGMFVWVIGDRVFAGGGTSTFGGSGFGTVYDDMYEYLPASDTWVQLSTVLPVPLAFASAVASGSKGYLFFGIDNNQNYKKEVHVFDTLTRAWTSGSDCPCTPRNAGIAALLSGKVYAGLGQSSLTTNFTDCYAYDLAANSWTRLADHPSDKSGWAVAFASGTSVYAGTGLNLPTFDFSSSLYKLTPGSTGIAQAQADNGALQLYPNPATGVLHIATGSQDALTYRIADPAGKTCATGTARNSIDLHELASGMYIIAVDDGKNTAFARFAKE